MATSVERKRKSRERRANGYRIVSVEIHEDTIRDLVAEGWIPAEKNGGDLHITRADIGSGINWYLEDSL